ncbi:MAG: serine/threonine-protein kinase [Pyrinomonadaceae bacterium]
MDNERWQKIKSIFESASELPEADRREFLDEKCGKTGELRAEIEKLFHALEEADTSFLEEPAEKEVISQILEKETIAMKAAADAPKHDAFVAGTVLDGRYRIIGLLGKGGMGEVYKAEDIKLDQTVALKFLPEKLAGNEDALRRFLSEVKIARQVSHENVCRVFDIGETGGKNFLSMEFINGDDLSQLLNRIGRLPSDKAIEISRQICLGLNAIHKTGILHRDLKPANIIVDSAGKARITDFGIAGFEADVQGAESRVGTPAYMSPEQITGKEVTQKSDIYSLGLLIYEIFTGKQAVKGDSLQELIDIHQSQTPTNPSEFVENIDPLVEKIISRCLEKNPQDRPDSAAQVALALPGGNPLEVALEAGETPSPEMVAAAPVKGTLKPLIALALLLGFIGMFSLVRYWSSVYEPNGLSPLEKSPDVLAERSKTIIKNLGFTDPAADTHSFIAVDESYRRFAEEKKNPREWWERIQKGQPLFYYYHYRQSPEYLIPFGALNEISPGNPPLNRSGMINIELDMTGRLIALAAVPPERVPRAVQEKKADWKKVFAEAGLEIDKFREVEPKWNPPFLADENKQWEGAMADFPDIPLRINGSSLYGKPIEFNVTPPWHEPAGDIQQKITQTVIPTGFIFYFVILILVLFASILLVRYNLKKGSGDLKGAVKLAVFIFAAVLLFKILTADWRPDFENLLNRSFALFAASLSTPLTVFVVYLAVEPLIRKRWTEVLVSWNRLLRGEFRNPMIGRDILVGFFLSVCTAILCFCSAYGRFLMNPDSIVEPFRIRNSLYLNGITSSVGSLLEIIPVVVTGAFVTLFVLLIFSLLLKKRWMAISATFAFFVLTALPDAISQNDWLFLVYAVFGGVFGLFAVLRFGFMALIAFIFMNVLNSVTTNTYDPSSFYFPTTIMLFALVFGIAFYAFFISIGGQPIFSGKVLEKFEN